MSHTAHPTQTLDELDPHHESHHHGHVILRVSTLAGVLIALLILTFVTVAAAQVEAWIAHAFNVHIPSLLNAFVALSIAVVKAVLVFMYFMQLRYDSPLNSIVMGFTFFAVGLFFFFTMIDLGNRDAIYPFKSGEIQRGGMGISVEGRVDTQKKPITAWARDHYMEQIRAKAAAGTLNPPLAPGETVEMRFEKEREKAHAKARGGHGHHAPTLSSANASRPPRAVGPVLYAEQTPAKAHDHGGH